MKRCGFMFFGFCLLTIALFANKITLIVSNPGAVKRTVNIFQADFTTFPEAIQKSREFGKELKKILVIADGKYFLDKPLILDSRDDNLTIVSQKGAHPTLYGGEVIHGWVKMGDHLWAANLPRVQEGKWDFRMISVNGTFNKQARLPRSGYFKNLNKWDVPWLMGDKGWKRKPSIMELATMKFNPPDIGLWLDTNNARINILHQWGESIVRVISVNERDSTITLRDALEMPAGAFNLHSYEIWNIQEGMTDPGQWYLDNTHGRLVYWPKPGEDMQKVEVIAPVMESIIRVEGTNEFPVTGLQIRGIAFSVTNSPWTSGGFGALNIDGVIHLSYVHNSEIDRVTIFVAGSQGIKENGCEDLVIHHCTISNVGAGGICLGDGYKVVSDNRISHTGLLQHSGVGINIVGRSKSGSIVSHNEIFDVPYIAISVLGDNHKIDSNSIRHAMQVLNDGGCIYLHYCKNVKVRGNVIRDIETKSTSVGYYLDEQAVDCLVEGNISLNVAHPCHNHMAISDTIRNNVFSNKGDILLTFPGSKEIVFVKNIVSCDEKLLLQNPEAISAMQKNIFFSLKGITQNIRENNAISDPRITVQNSGRIIYESNSIQNEIGIKFIDGRRTGIRK